MLEIAPRILLVMPESFIDFAFHERDNRLVLLQSAAVLLIRDRLLATDESFSPSSSDQQNEVVAVVYLIEARVLGVLVVVYTKAWQIGSDRFMPEIFQVL